MGGDGRSDSFYKWFTSNASREFHCLMKGLIRERGTLAFLKASVVVDNSKIGFINWVLKNKSYFVLTYD